MEYTGHALRLHTQPRESTHSDRMFLGARMLTRLPGRYRRRGGPRDGCTGREPSRLMTDLRSWRRTANTPTLSDLAGCTWTSGCRGWPPMLAANRNHWWNLRAHASPG